MAKVELNPLLKAIRGKIDKAIFRRTPSGEVTISKSPDMSGVVWSEAQHDHRMDMKEAFHYAKTATDIPEMRDYYLAMARRIWNNNRPYDMAVSDYCQGNNRLKEFYVPGKGLVVPPAPAPGRLARLLHPILDAVRNEWPLRPRSQPQAQTRTPAKRQNSRAGGKRSSSKRPVRRTSRH
jgi:hypothetical protein